MLLQEAGLSRILKHMQEHDSGGITGWRGARDCGRGEKYTRSENNARNVNLAAKIKAGQYAAINVGGIYIEDGVPVKERSFFVYDISDKGTLLEDLIKWGGEFEQESILFVPKGGKEGIIHGTSRCNNLGPDTIKRGQTINVGKRYMGKMNQYGTSTIRNRPWMFSESVEDFGEEVPAAGSMLNSMYRANIAKMSPEEYVTLLHEYEKKLHTYLGES